jgi:hypothetical protein
MIGRFSMAVCILFASLVSAVLAESNLTQTTYSVRVTLGGQSLTATLQDSPTTRELISMLPLDLPGRDFMHFEKIADLPRKLTTEGAPSSHTPTAGDFAYYHPWGNLALFHADWNPSPGLVLLGRFDGPVDALRNKGNMPVRIEIIEK